MNWRLSALLLIALTTGAAVWTLVGKTTAESPVIRATVVHRPVALPKVQLDETRHSFGVMDLDETGEHTFIIRNVGEGELDLRLSKTSCECTVGELAESQVPPGGRTQVRLKWHPPQTAELFAQGATIATNDPRAPSLYLHVVGAVRKRLAATQDALLLNPAVGEDAQQRVVVYSQAWDDFAIDARCDHPAIDISVAPADEEDLKKLEARAGYTVTAHLRPELPRGTFQAMLRIEAASPPSEQETSPTRHLELPIHGHVSGRVSVQGGALEEGDRLELGTLWRGQGKTALLAILVRGEHADLVMDRIETNPDFVKVRVGGREQVARNLCRYKLEVEIPHDAPITHCVAKAAGQIVLATNHPDSPELKLAVDFAILEKP